MLSYPVGSVNLLHTERSNRDCFTPFAMTSLTMRVHTQTGEGPARNDRN